MSFNYLRVKLKNQKPIVVDVLFKAYPMVTLSCKSNLAGWYLLKTSNFEVRPLAIQREHPDSSEDEI